MVWQARILIAVAPLWACASSGHPAGDAQVEPVAVDATDSGETLDSEPADTPGGCGPNEFWYHDQSRGQAPGRTVGDDKCYLKCALDADCPPSQPNCTIQGLFDGHDWDCQAQVRICRVKKTDDCKPK